MSRTDRGQEVLPREGVERGQGLVEDEQPAEESQRSRVRRSTASSGQRDLAQGGL